MGDDAHHRNGVKFERTGMFFAMGLFGVALVRSVGHVELCGAELIRRTDWGI